MYTGSIPVVASRNAPNGASGPRRAKSARTLYAR